MAYIVWPVILVMIALYSLSYFLVIRNIMTLATHKRIWNFALLLCFLAVGSSGIIMSLGIYPENALFFHVEAGIVLVMVASFHIIWHMYYFKDYFRKKND